MTVHLIFNTLLPVFCVIAIIVGTFLVGRSSLTHKKSWKGCIIAAGIVLALLSSNLIYLVSFSSPEDAYVGLHSRPVLSDRELLTIEGETSAWVLGSDNSQFVTKEGDRWKLTGLSTMASPDFFSEDNITIAVEGLSTSRDRYICVTLFPAPEECHIDAPEHTVFYEKSNPDTEGSEFHSRTFYAYIGTLEEDFHLTVNGTEFTIPTTALLTGPSRFFMDSFKMMICFALIILGIILICRRVKNPGWKAAGITGVVMLGLTLATLSIAYPPETAFMHYQFPEAAFYYIHGNTGELTVEGDTTSLVVNDHAHCIIQKTDEGWKHPFPFEAKTEYTGSDRGVSVTVYRDRTSDECYLRIDTPKRLEHDILPRGRWFTYSEYPGAPSDAMAILYGYLGKLESPFEITIDGVHFTIPES